MAKRSLGRVLYTFSLTLVMPACTLYQTAFLFSVTTARFTPEALLRTLFPDVDFKDYSVLFEPTVVSFTFLLFSQLFLLCIFLFQCIFIFS
ncbi:hypothetical protein FKM82_019488 [Ascaphus truei]